MRKTITLLCAAMLFASAVVADDTAEMTFKNKNHNFGIVAQDTCVVSCVFTFTNTGNAPLIVHQAVSSCGCTVPEYTQEPIAPGATGTINVTYNGRTKRPGVFKKSITIHSNAVNTPVRVYIEGEMIAEDNIEELVPVAVADEQPEAKADTVAAEPQTPRKPGLLRRLFAPRKKEAKEK